MLTGRTEARPRPAVRRAVLRTAWWPACRALPRPTVASACGLAIAPALLTTVRGGDDLGGALLAATLLGAGVLAFAVEDPAGETLAASPTSLARRRSLRFSGLALAAALTWAAALALSAAAGPLTGHELAERAAEAAATGGLAAAIAGLTHRLGTSSPALLGAAGGPLMVLIISAFAQRLPELPGVGGGAEHARWWLVAGAAWLLTAWTWRDPARRYRARDARSGPHRQARAGSTA